MVFSSGVFCKFFDYKSLGNYSNFLWFFLLPQCKNLSPKYMLLVMYIEHYKSTNDLHLLATTISYEPPGFTVMRKWLSFKLINVIKVSCHFNGGIWLCCKILIWLPSKLYKSAENLATRIEHCKFVTSLKPFGHKTMYHTIPNKDLNMTSFRWTLIWNPEWKTNLVEITMEWLVYVHTILMQIWIKRHCVDFFHWQNFDKMWDEK